MKIASENRGQATVIMVVFLVVICGMVALVLDVGSWYRADRALQAEADAAALAAAQALPESTGDATTLALQYANKNGGGLTTSGISFSSKVVANDTIKVQLSKPVPGFFSSVLGLGGATVAAHAAARSDNINAAKFVAPIVVNWQHPAFKCKPIPCSDPTTITLTDLHTNGSGAGAGSFGLINLDQEDVGANTPDNLASWMLNGFNAYLPLGDYNAIPSTMYNSTQMISALQARIGTEVLFPVYKVLTGPGVNADFKIIGWAGFYITGFTANGSGGTVSGYFTRYIAEGLQVTSANGVPDYGVRAIQLVD